MLALCLLERNNWMHNILRYCSTERLMSLGIIPKFFFFSSGRATVCSILTWRSSTIFPSWRPRPWKSSSLTGYRFCAAALRRWQTITAPFHVTFWKLFSCSKITRCKSAKEAGDYSAIPVDFLEVQSHKLMAGNCSANARNFLEVLQFLWWCAHNHTVTSLVIFWKRCLLMCQKTAVSTNKLMNTIYC